MKNKKLTAEDKLATKNYVKGLNLKSNKLLQAKNTESLNEKIKDLADYILNSEESKQFNKIKGL